MIQTTILGPDGRVYQVNGLKTFCREHKLDNGNMYQVYMGSRRHCRGYTCPEAGYIRTYVRNRG